MADIVLSRLVRISINQSRITVRKKFTMHFRQSVKTGDVAVLL